jgi:hypothetical protein
MVKNKTGGKHKFRQRVGAETGAPRLVTAEPDENYAVVERLNGNVLHVSCDDGTKQICHIRKAFRYKKYDNRVTIGGGILVRKRHDMTAKTHCDLVRVYTDEEVGQIPPLYRLCHPEEAREEAAAYFVEDEVVVEPSAVETTTREEDEAIDFELI